MQELRDRRASRSGSEATGSLVASLVFKTSVGLDKVPGRFDSYSPPWRVRRREEEDEGEEERGAGSAAKLVGATWGCYDDGVFARGARAASEARAENDPSNLINPSPAAGLPDGRDRLDCVGKRAPDSESKRSAATSRPFSRAEREQELS